jgi:hypothetical protein
MSSTLPAGSQKRVPFRASLPRNQRATLDALARLVNNKRATLDWYHELGRLVCKLRQESGEQGTWWTTLGESLRYSASLLRRTARFAEIYPTKREIQELKEMGVTWTMLWLTFSIQDETHRHEVLRQAISENWAIPKLKAEVSRQFPSKRRGVGGRPRKVESYDPETNLRTLDRKSREWLGFYDAAWAKTKQTDLKPLLKSGDRPEREKIRGLIERMCRTLKR